MGTTSGCTMSGMVMMVTSLLMNPYSHSLALMWFLQVVFFRDDHRTLLRRRSVTTPGSWFSCCKNLGHDCHRKQGCLQVAYKSCWGQCILQDRATTSEALLPELRASRSPRSCQTARKGIQDTRTSSLCGWVSEVGPVERFSMGKDRMHPPMWFWLRDI